MYKTLIKPRLKEINTKGLKTDKPEYKKIESSFKKEELKLIRYSP